MEKTFNNFHKLNKRQGSFTVAYDSKWLCIRQCAWDNHLWNLRDVAEVQKGDTIPHHFDCITAPPKGRAQK